MTDINELCNIIGCTSRTLRFYEEKGIIESTKEPYNDRRKYTDEQIKHIKNVFVLRSLGLPVSKIKGFLSNNISLSEVICERKTELIASMVSKTREYNLLCEALSTIENGGDIFNMTDIDNKLNDMKHTANIFTELFISKTYDICFEYFSDMLREYLPLSAFRRVVSDTLNATGSIISKKSTIYDEQYPNTFYSYIKCEKYTLCLKLTIFSNKIHGIWLSYS